MARTLGQIAHMIRRRLGWPTGDTFVSSDELKDMILESRNELFDLLVSIHQGDYRPIQTQFTTLTNQAFYLLSPNNPASTGGPPDLQVDFARIIKIGLIVDNRVIPMKRWDIETSVDELTPQPWNAGTDIRYRIVDGFTDGVTEKGIYFTPAPNGAFDVFIAGVWGVANTSFSLTTALNTLGHDEYLVLDCAIKCLQMEETDTTLFERQKDRYVAMLQNNAPPVDVGQPETIHDARTADKDIGFMAWRR